MARSIFLFNMHSNAIGIFDVFDKGNQMKEFHTPKNEQPIEELFVVLSREPDGTEGIVAKITSMGTMPLVFGHERMLEIIKPFLKDISEDSGKKLIIAKYKRIEILEEIN